MKKTVQYSIVFLLAVTGALKVFSAVREVNILHVQHEILAPLTYREFFLSAGLAEIFAAFWLASRSKSYLSKAIVVGCVAAAFSSYRVVAAVGNFSAPCGCLGHALNWTGLPSGDVEIYSSYVYGLFMALAGAYIWLYLKGNPKDLSIKTTPIQTVGQ